MGYQNFFATKLFTDCGASDTTLTLDTPPTVTSGRLVLEARNTSKREIVSYTGVSGNQVTGVTRGVGGTTATDHAKNALVEMNVTAEDLAEAFAVPTDLEDKWNKTFVDYIESGLVWSLVSGLNATMTVGVAYIDGIKISLAAIASRTFTVSKDTYIDIGNNGTIYYTEVTNGAAQPALTAGRIRVALVVTNASAITYVVNYPNSNALAVDTGWRHRVLPSVSSVTSNGARSYDITFASTVASILSPGMRLLINRTVPAPTQCTSLNGTTQYWSKSAPAGMTFVDDFFISAWVKLTNLPTTQGCIVSRYTAGNGFILYVDGTGQIVLTAYKGGVANYSRVISYQSIPVGKWVHVAAQLDMSSYPTVSSTTSYVMIDGIDAAAVMLRGGTNPTDFTQAGNLQIGAYDGATAPFPGKIAQVAIHNAKIGQSNIPTRNTVTVNPGGSASMVSAYDFNNNSNDLNTTNANNLSAVASATATNADAPFCYSGVSTTIDYAIVQTVNGAVVNATVPEGCTIPASSNGVNSVAYSTQSKPFGWPLPTAFGIGSTELNSVATAETTTSASPVELATLGPRATIWVGPSGMAKVHVGGLLKNSGVAFAHMWPYVDNTDLGIISGVSVVNTNEVSAGKTRLVTGLGQGWHTFIMRYSVSGGTGTYQQRLMSAEPVNDGRLL